MPISTRVPTQLNASTEIIVTSLYQLIEEVLNQVTTVKTCLVHMQEGGLLEKVGPGGQQRIHDGSITFAESGLDQNLRQPSSRARHRFLRGDQAGC